MASLIVAGATGAIGRTVVQHAARHDGIARIVALTRSKDTSAEHYPKLFGIYTDAAKRDSLAKNESVLTAEEAKKIQPVTLDWDAFLSGWQALKEAYKATPTSHEGGSGVHATLPDTVKRQVDAWKAIFSGHTFVAMCLGTTRADAGSADGFIRCDYDYVIAFAEAMQYFSGPSGFAFSAAFPCPRGFVDTKDPVSHNRPFLYEMGDKTEGFRLGSSRVFAEAWPKLKLHCDTTQSSRTLRRWVQVSASNASRTSFLLYSKTKGCADMAVAERVLAMNELALAGGEAGEVGAAGLQTIAFLCPGLLERYDKTRGKEKAVKWLLPSLGVEKCGKCAVADLVFDDKHLKNKTAEEDVYDTARPDPAASSSTSPKWSPKVNKFAFAFGSYHTPVAAKQQGAHHGNKMLYYWQGNEEIKAQAERLDAALATTSHTS